jgi:hypothetical protein
VKLAGLIIAVVVAAFLGVTSTASGASAHVEHPVNAPPAWFTDAFRERVDAAGLTGVPVAGR